MLRDELVRCRASTKYLLKRLVLRNPRSATAFAFSDRKLTAEQTRVVDQLRRDGVARSTFSDLIGDTPLWQQLQSGVDSFAGSAVVQAASHEWLHGVKPDSRKGYLVRLYGDPANVAISDPWLAFGLHDSVLRIVNAYLGLFSRLMAFDLWYTLPTPEGRIRSGSQVWHRDPEDRRMIKAFLYFSDVSAESGSLEYIKGTRLGEAFGPRRYYGDGWKRGHAEPVSDSSRVLCSGPSGSVVFCDTTGLHRGGYSPQSTRVLANWLFTTPATLYRRRFTVTDGRDRSSLSAAASWALR